MNRKERARFVPAVVVAAAVSAVPLDLFAVSMYSLSSPTDYAEG